MPAAFWKLSLSVSLILFRKSQMISELEQHIQFYFHQRELIFWICRKYLVTGTQPSLPSSFLDYVASGSVAPPFHIAVFFLCRRGQVWQIWTWEISLFCALSKHSPTWLYAFVMSRLRFRVNLHSIVDWMPRNAFLKTGAISKV